MADVTNGKPTAEDDPTNGHHENGDGENGKKKHHKKKKSRHFERIEMLSKEKSAGTGAAAANDEYRSKKIHVRSKDPMRIAKQFEKADKKQKSSKHHRDDRDHRHPGSSGGKKVIPPQQKINQICKVCGKEPYVVERVIAEKCWWHKNCFRCKTCDKTLSLDTYMSHEGVLYCKPHHKELFLPKTVKSDIIDVENVSKTQEAILRHQEQQKRMETIIRENNPVDLGDAVVKSTTYDKYSGLEDLDVGSKFKMFEKASNEDDLELERGPSSDRYGIMEKLKRLQEGADLDELLAEMDEELPSDEEEEEDFEDAYLTEVQKKSKKAEKLFSEDVKKHKKDEKIREEIQSLRRRLNCGGTSSHVADFDDLLNASSHKVQKTKVDVRSENARRFRDMFDKGEVPEKQEEKISSEKEAELEQMRKTKRQQREYFKMMEAGKLQDENEPRKEPKLLVGKLKSRGENANGDLENIEDLPELDSLSNRFSYFENFKDKEQKKKGGDGGEAGVGNENDAARRECKASSVLSKFKEMENRVLNGEPDVEARKRPLKRFTPPRKLGSDSETETGSDYSDSDYTESYSSSYSGSSSSSDSEDEEDETLKAIREAQRAKELRAKFEEWEKSQDAKDQLAQMSAFDENGERLETAGLLRKKFEALKMYEEEKNKTPPPIKAQFRPKRFK